MNTCTALPCCLKLPFLYKPYRGASSPSQLVDDTVLGAKDISDRDRAISCGPITCQRFFGIGPAPARFSNFGRKSASWEPDTAREKVGRGTQVESAKDVHRSVISPKGLTCGFPSIYTADSRARLRPGQKTWGLVGSSCDFSVATEVVRIQ